MTIERIDENNIINEKVRLLNNMIMELNGLIQKARFDKNELDNLYDQLSQSGFALDRKFLRNQNLGHTLATYTGWSHLHAESGYSIWKYSPTNYVYNANNQLYLDNAILTNMGQASAESATSFDYVFLYDSDASGGAIYVDDTTEAGTEVGASFYLMSISTDYLYFGSASKFGAIKFEFDTKGAGYTNYYQYYNGTTWVTITSTTDSLVDNTSDFESDGLVTFSQPDAWVQSGVDGNTAYWIRVYSSTTPTTIAQAFYSIPGNTVPGLLALSSSEIFAETWKWCTYGSTVYITIRNTGNSSYEGDYYIASSSSATNLQNYWIYNHTISADYCDNTYSGV